jgi:hypothetical protein
MPLTNGSGSWIRILLFSLLTFKMPAKKYFFNTIFSARYFLKVHLHYFLKIKSQKESQNRFFLLFLHDNRRIRIREAKKHVDPVDPDRIQNTVLQTQELSGWIPPCLTAGMSERAPRKKQVDSEREERSMEGATSPTIRPTCSACVSWDRLQIIFFFIVHGP